MGTFYLLPEKGNFYKANLHCHTVVSDGALTPEQVKEAYQAQIDARQNSNMQFLTVLSTIFFPLTLITGWYGMNFRDMPGLDDGYPWVVCLSIVVILICLFIFKKKHII